MPYSVNNTDSSLNFTVQDGSVDTSTLSVSLIGTNAENYADDIARNDVQLLENFASTSEPTAGTVLTGQLWYDKTDNVLRVYKGTTGGWVNLEPLVVGTVPTRLTARLGERYFDTSNNKLYLYDGASWRPTGYGGNVTSELSGNSLVHNPTLFGAKVRAIFLKDTSGRPHPCMALVYVNNSTSNELYGSGTNGETIMALFNHDDNFTADNVVSDTEGDSINYYAELNATGGIGITINKGMNLRSDYISEAVQLATRAVTADKANALQVGGSVINASDFARKSDDIVPTADKTYSLGSASSMYESLFIQRIDFDSTSQAAIDIKTDNLLTLGNATNRAKEIYTYDLFATDDITVGDDLSVTGNSNLTGNVDVTNHLQVNQNIRSNATVFGSTLTDNTLQINSGSITSAVNGTFSGTVQYGSLSDGAITITSFVDEDNMASDSAVRVPTQQSVKAYVDTSNTEMKSYVDVNNAAQDLDITTDSGTIDILIDSETLTIAGGDGIGSSATGTTATLAVDSTVARTNVNETFDANVIITGNLTVSGTTTTVNSATLSVADNIITLNSDEAGTPSQNAGIEVERGSSTNVKLRWNETDDKWQFTNDGSTYSDITTFTNFSVTSNSASGNGALAYNNSNGVFTFTPADTSLATKTTQNLAEHSSALYYTDARVLTKIQATNLTEMSDVNYSSPSNGQTLQYNTSTSKWEAQTPASGVTELVNLNDVHGGGGASTGQVLSKLANGDFGFDTVSSTNNYLTGATFDTGTGIITFTRQGLGDVTANIDGRFSTFSGAYGDLTGTPTVHAEPGIFSGGGTPTLATGVTAAEIRSLIGAGTSSVDGEGTPAILSDGATPTLNSGITAAEVRSLIGAGTSSSDSDTLYSAGSGITKNTSGTTAGAFSHEDTSSVSNLSASGRTYITGMTFDTYGHVQSYTTGTETDQSFSDTNYYLNGLSFNTGTGVLTATVNGAANQTVDLDGRFLTEVPSTISAATTFSSSTASSSKTTGAVIVTGGIGVGGAGYFGADVVAYATSDERLKDNIMPIEDALEKIQKIRGVEFDWNDKQETFTGHDTGVIAQEVKEVLPEVVTEREDGMLAVKYEKMVGLLIESIKDLKAEVDDLKEQLRKNTGTNYK